MQNSTSSGVFLYFTYRKIMRIKTSVYLLEMRIAHIDKIKNKI